MTSYANIGSPGVDQVSWFCRPGRFSTCKVGSGV